MKLVSAFALRDLNITKLESQPACHVKNDMFSGRHFDDLFFVDFEPKVGPDPTISPPLLPPYSLRLTHISSVLLDPFP